MPEEPETVVIGRTRDLATLAAAPAAGGGLAVRRVTDGADLRRVGALEAAVWGGDFGRLVRELAAGLAAAPDDLVVLVAEADGLVVSAGWLVFPSGTEFATLWGGSTLPAYRGRGAYRSLVTARAR